MFLNVWMLRLQQLKELARENESLRGKLGRIEAGSLTDQVKQIAGVSVLAAQVNAADMDSLRNIVDEMKGEARFRCYRSWRC